MLDTIIIISVSVVFILYFRKRYIVYFVNHCINIEVPVFSESVITIPEKNTEISDAEHLNVIAGKVLAEKVPDARLIEFRESVDAVSMVYFSAHYISLFTLTLAPEKEDRFTVTITGEKFIKTGFLKEELNKTGDYLLPYKTILNEIHHYESQFEVKFFDFTVFKRLFKKNQDQE